MPSIKVLQQIQRRKVIEHREQAAAHHKAMLASFHRGKATERECDEALESLVKWDRELKLVMGSADNGEE